MSYIRPADEQWQAEIEIKRSQFIGIARRTSTEQAAREFIDEIRSRYPDARHHCSAYIVHRDDAQAIERSSDDGEPAGTAGQPMLEVLKGTDALDVTVVVVRYFGGVLLGTGGLVRAYQDATKAVLAKVRWVERTQLDLFRVELDHAEAGKIESELRNQGYQILSTEYGATVTLQLVGDDALAERLAAMTAGAVEAKSAGQWWVDVERP